MEPVLIKVFDMAGRQVEQLKGSAGESFHFGSRLMQGMYIVEVRQGDHVRILQVVKI
jgi:hypothetical protein